MSVYLKASLVPTKHKPISFKFIQQFLHVFVLFLLILLDCKSQNVCETYPYAPDISKQFLIDFNPDFRLPKFNEVLEITEISD